MKLVLINAIMGLLIINSAYAQKFDLNGVTNVVITHYNPSNDLPVSTTILHSFPAYGISVITDTLSVKKNKIWLRCPVRTLEIAYIFIGDQRFETILRPGDTVNIVVRDSSSFQTISFKNEYQAIQHYYLQKSVRFPISTEQLMMNSGVACSDLNIFKMQADSLYSLRSEFWENYEDKKKLPDWFVRYEIDAIRYANAYVRIYVLDYFRLVTKGEHIPVSYFDFLESIPIQNQRAIYDYYYLHFLSKYLIYKINEENGKINQSLTFKISKEMLGEEIGNFLMLYQISLYLSGNPVKVQVELSKYDFGESFRFLVDFLISRSELLIERLPKGALAPDFSLINDLDSLVSLNQFRDTIVYLSFWFPGCKGCVQEFPYENALVKKFNGQPFKIISICTNSKKQNWIATIKKYNLKTLNLFANDLWQDKLEREYSINTYPHYVLIDGSGRIIENFAPRPREISKRIEIELQRLLGEYPK